jgi:hypothetical protein
VTVVKPILKFVPDVSVVDTEGVLQLSVAVGGVQVTMTTVSEIVFDTFAGQGVKMGLMVSVVHGFVMVTVKEQVALFFLSSVAV